MTTFLDCFVTAMSAHRSNFCWNGISVTVVEVDPLYIFAMSLRVTQSGVLSHSRF